ncbi:MAG: M23 family metallopeptidase [Thiotrichaceae bacterium]
MQQLSLSGWQSGYGNTVILQHDEHRDTVYAHISKFAEIKPAQNIKQGDVIGYVGKTGVTTGTHLHYEFRYDDEPRNQRNLPTNPAIQHALGEDINHFFMNTQTVVTQLDHANGIVQKILRPEMTSLAKAAGVDSYH